MLVSVAAARDDEKRDDCLQLKSWPLLRQWPDPDDPTILHMGHPGQLLQQAPSVTCHLRLELCPRMCMHVWIHASVASSFRFLDYEFQKLDSLKLICCIRSGPMAQPWYAQTHACPAPIAIAGEGARVMQNGVSGWPSLFDNI